MVLVCTVLMIIDKMVMNTMARAVKNINCLQTIYSENIHQQQ